LCAYHAAGCWLLPVGQEPGLLQTLYQTVAEPQDIFYINFGRWHYSNCKGLQLEPYQLALWHLGKLYEVRGWVAASATTQLTNHLKGVAAAIKQAAGVNSTSRHGEEMKGCSSHMLAGPLSV
jgi:hypothetical protein